MTRFVFKVVIFTLPLALVLAFPVMVFLLGREEYSSATVARLQTTNPDLVIGKAFVDDSDNGGRIYKKVLVREKNPELIVIGSSRALAFRQEFFSKPEAFANAAFGGASMEKMEEFIRALPDENNIRVLLLSLDQKWFKPDFSAAGSSGLTVGERVAEFFTHGWREIYFDYLRGKFTIRGLIKSNRNTDNVGLTALVDGTGYRADGSYRHGNEPEEKNRRAVLMSRVDASIAALRVDRNLFQYGPDISLDALESLDRALAEAKERHIVVIGFIMPYHQSLYAGMLSTPDSYREAVFALPRAIRERFSRYDFEVYDFTDATSLHASGGEFIDETHPSDKLTLRMVLSAAKRDRVLRAYVDTKAVEFLLGSTPEDILPLDLK